MARGRPLLIQNSEDRVIGCYPLAVCEGRCGAEADMRSSPRCEADVLLDDGCSTFAVRSASYRDAGDRGRTQPSRAWIPHRQTA
jgi:hypothetical protein